MFYLRIDYLHRRFGLRRRGDRDRHQPAHRVGHRSVRAHIRAYGSSDHGFAAPTYISTPSCTRRWRNSQLGYPLLFRGYGTRISTHSTYFLTTVPRSGASLPSTGSSPVASSPASTVQSRHYDFLSPFPPHFVAFAWRYHGCTRKFRSRAGRVRQRGPGVSNPVSPTGIFRGDDRTSQVPGEPRYPSAHVLRLRQDCSLQTNSEQQHGPRQRQSEGSHNETFEAQ